MWTWARQVVFKSVGCAIRMNNWQKLTTLVTFLETFLCFILVVAQGDIDYRGISLIRNTSRLGPYSRTIPRDLW